MKTYSDCLPCFLRQALQVARINKVSPEEEERIVKKIAALLPSLDVTRTPPENSIPVYDTIAAMTGCADPYASLKQQSNDFAFSLLPQIKQEIATAEDPLAQALKFSVAGNIIDYGAAADFDIESTIEKCRTTPFAIDHSSALVSKIESLPKGATILYLVDNCGEIIFDSLVIEHLHRHDIHLFVAVKSGPIINDALAEDALLCGIDNYATIIENGTSCPGTPLDLCSQELQNIFAKADLILSKGQGNFECLSEQRRAIFFLLTVKCKVVGQHLAQLAQRPVEQFPGKGEMVILEKGHDQ